MAAARHNAGNAQASQVKSTRRPNLENIAHQTSSHPGLWLDKFLRGARDDEKIGGPEKSALISAITKTAVPIGYSDALKLRCAGFEEQRDAQQLLLAEASSSGRLVIGLGAKGVVEAGLRLDHTWGVPFLPGSSLKGLAAAAAHKLVQDDDWRKPAEKQDEDASDEERQLTSFETLFGTTDSSGAVIFHDAWWIPEDVEEEKLPIHHDVMTVHHPNYYQSEEPDAPSDMDSPIPVPFTTVNGRYLIALEGEKSWRDAAYTLLEMGLRELGIGAKTNAGYGRMNLERRLSEEERLALVERARIEESQRELVAKLELLGNSRNLPQQARDRLMVLQSASEMQIEQNRIDAAANALFQIDPKWWKDWRKKESRADEERTLFDRFLSPLTQPQPSSNAVKIGGATQPVPSERVNAQAWIEVDNKNRKSLMLLQEGEKKPTELKLHTIKDKVDSSLEKALLGKKSAPVAVLVELEGKKKLASIKLA